MFLIYPGVHHEDTGRPLWSDSQLALLRSFTSLKRPTLKLSVMDCLKGFTSLSSPMEREQNRLSTPTPTLGQTKKDDNPLPLRVNFGHTRTAHFALHDFHKKIPLSFMKPSTRYIGRPFFPTAGDVSPCCPFDEGGALFLWVLLKPCGFVFYTMESRGEAIQLNLLWECQMDDTISYALKHQKRATRTREAKFGPRWHIARREVSSDTERFYLPFAASSWNQLRIYAVYQNFGGQDRFELQHHRLLDLWLPSPITTLCFLSPGDVGEGGNKNSESTPSFDTSETYPETLMAGCVNGGVWRMDHLAQKKWSRVTTAPRLTPLLPPCTPTAWEMNAPIPIRCHRVGLRRVYHIDPRPNASWEGDALRPRGSTLFLFPVRTLSLSCKGKKETYWLAALYTTLILWCPLERGESCPTSASKNHPSPDATLPQQKGVGVVQYLEAMTTGEVYKEEAKV